MKSHAETLNILASRLADLTGRLESTMDRMVGPQPQSASKATEQPEPVGVLYVAKYGAERIGAGLDRLAESISRLNTIV